MPDVSFLTLLTDMAVQGNVPLNPVTGAPEIPPEQEHRYASYLSQGLRTIWRKYGRLTLEETLTWGTVTLAAGAVIPKASIEGSDFWNVWESDPREEIDTQRWKRKLDAEQLATGDVKVFRKAAGDEVFVFWRKAVPQLGAQRLRPNAQAPANALRWNYAGAEAAHCGDGHVYRNVSGETAPESSWEDPQAWQRVSIPEALHDVTVNAGLYQRAISEKDGNAMEYWAQQFEIKFDEVQRKQEQTPGARPWLYHAGA